MKDHCRFTLYELEDKTPQDYCRITALKDVEGLYECQYSCAKCPHLEALEKSLTLAREAADAESLSQCYLAEADKCEGDSMEIVGRVRRTFKEIKASKPNASHDQEEGDGTCH